MGHSENVGTTVTLLFTDLVGSTEILDELGDERAENVRRAHFRLLRDAIAANSGREVKSLGDGFMIVFPSVVQSLVCARRMQEQVEIRNRNHPYRRALYLRIGINVGDVINEDDDYFGRPVVVAKRLCDRAEPGQVLVSDVAISLLGSDREFTLRPMGLIPLKGLADPVNTWDLLWAPEGEPMVPRGRAQPLIDDDYDYDESTPPASIPLPRSLITASGGNDFVGRAPQLGKLSNHLDRARSGDRRLVLLAGEPGIGKTRLCSELGREASDEGDTVLYGRCDEEALVPFQPFIEALSHYVGNCPPAILTRQVEAIGGELCRVLPELEWRVPGIIATPSQDPNTERYRLFEAVDLLVSAITDRSPLVLILDDLHWADKPSLLLLRHIIRSPRRARVLIVGTYRDNEFTVANPLFDLVADLRRSDTVERIRLGGLSETELDELISAWSGQATPPGLARALWRDTEGHPFFAREVLRHLLETGALSETGGRLIVSRSITALGIPQGVKELVERRLTRLGDGAQRLLTIASVVGPSFPLAVLERVWEGQREELYEVLEEAAAAGIIGERSGPGADYSFSHALMREVLYEGLFAGRRAEFHRMIGEAFEALSATDRHGFLAERAHHFFEAACWHAEGSEVAEKAITCGIAAARQSIERTAYEEAAQQYARVLDALAFVAPDDIRRCDVLLGYGESQWRAGEFDRARQAFVEAADLATTRQDGERLTRAALGYAGPSGFGAGLVDPVLIELLERALGTIPEGERARTRVIGRLAEALTFSTSRDRGRELAQQAVEGARRLGDKADVAEVLSNATWPLWTPDNLDWRIQTATEIAELAKEAGAIRTLWEGYTWLVGDYMEKADIAAVDAQLEQCRRIAEQVREPVYVGFNTVLTAMRALLAGDMDAAEELAWHGLVDFGHEGENTSQVQLFGVQMFHLRLLQGRIGELHAATAGMAEHFTAVAATRCSLAVLYCEAGRTEEARAEFDALAVDDFGWLPDDIFWLSCMDHLAEVCAYLEDAPRATVLYELLLPYADRYIVNGEFAVPRGFATRHLGLLAATCKRFDEAITHFEDALTRNARIGPPYALILTQLNYAQMLLTRDESGDRARALKLLETALRDSKQRGYPGLSDKISALMREAEAGGPVAARRRTLSERASGAAGGARVALSTRGRAALGKLFGGASDEALERRFGSHVAQRALFGAMASSFQPRAAYGFEGEIEFELNHYAEKGERPPDPDWWTIRVKRNRAVARRRTAEDAAVFVRINVPDFVRLFAGELNPVAVWLDKRATVEGDVTVGARLVEMFGGMAALDVVPPDEQTFLPRRAGEPDVEAKQALR